MFRCFDVFTPVVARFNRIRHGARVGAMMRGGTVAVGALVAATSGCATGPLTAMRAERYRIEVRLDPQTSRIVGRTVIDLVPASDSTVRAPRGVSRRGREGRAGLLSAASKEVGHPHADRTYFALLLHPDLRITHLAGSAEAVRWHRGSVRTGLRGQPFAPRRDIVSVAGRPESLTLFVDYEGRLRQDVATGEKAGGIHNFAMRAHIGTEGIYLAGGYWYPQPAVPDDHARGLAEFTLIADPVADQQLVASGESDDALAAQTGRLAWRCPYPLDAMVLVGGPHRVFRRSHHGIDLEAHVKPNQTVYADGLLATMRRNLDRYEPLIGPYPARQYSIVDNFFSSGFAFPTFTLLSSAVINMGSRSQTTHGYIDHEMLHSWWGNGVFVDPRDGNWCEALASYAANYYGYVLDGDEAEARRKRRNASHFLSRLTPDRDKPLGTYGREGGCGRGIAYQKGAMVFHMLARKIGQENFWTAMRRLTRRYTGRYASWGDIRHLCEEAGGTPLDGFFRQWVRRGGAPTLAVAAARFDTGENTLYVTLSQGEPAFDLDVPLRVTYSGGEIDTLLRLTAATEEVAVPLEVVPTGVEVDPDYHLFRKIAPGDIIPTTSATRHGDAFASVLPAGDVPDVYRTIALIFSSSFKESQRVELSVGELDDGVLARRSVLILGEAVRDSYVAAFLSAAQFPVKFTDEGFVFDGVIHQDPEDAVLCTIRHPDVVSGGITVVFANSASALPAAWNIPMYDRSLVIFKNKTSTVRRDFERRHIVPVQ